jgi:hypothetical protein
MAMAHILRIYERFAETMAFLLVMLVLGSAMHALVAMTHTVLWTISQALGA